jgi:hypothetical protein
MEGTLPFFYSNRQSFLQYLKSRVIGQFEVVDTSHNTREIVVGGIRRLTWLTHNREEWGQAFEAYWIISFSVHLKVGSIVTNLQWEVSGYQ